MRTLGLSIGLICLVALGEGCRSQLSVDSRNASGALSSPTSSKTGESPDGTASSTLPSTTDPQLTAVAPIIVAEGTSLTISGSGFTQATAFLLNGQAVKATVVSQTQATMIMPSGIALGAATLAVEPNGTLTIFNTGTSGLPFLAAAPSDVCTDIGSYIDQTGTTQKGTRACAPVADCDGTHVTGCKTTARYKAADVSSIQSTTLTADVTVGAVTGSLSACTNDGAVGCIPHATFKAGDLRNFGVADLAAGTAAGGLVGQALLSGALGACTADGQVGCNASGALAALATSSFNPFDLRAGRSIAGVKGRLKMCKSGADLSSLDAPIYPGNAGPDPMSIVAVPASGELVVASGSYPVSGTSVQITNSGGSLPGGLLPSTTYYVIAVDATDIKLATSLADAKAGTAITLTSAGAGTNTLTMVGNGALIWTDTIDDYHAGPSAQGAPLSATPFTSDDLCDGSDWQVLAPSPDGTTMVPGSATNCASPSDDCMIFDPMAREIWTKTIPAGRTWAQGIEYCNSLSFGGYTSGWRLPTQKEGIRALLDGMTSVTYDYPQFGDASVELWTATSRSSVTGWCGIGCGSFQAPYLNLAPLAETDSVISDFDGKNTTLGVKCVRDP